MARIRTVKPEFFTSEDIVRLTPLARLLYIALWCEADREGRFCWRPGTWKLRYFPGDDFKIDKLINELTRADACPTRADASPLVIQYGFGKYGHIPSFKKHQHVNPREAESKLPDPVDYPDACPTRADACPTRREEGKGREGKDIVPTVPSPPPAMDDVLVLECKPQNNGIPYEAIRKLYNEKLNELPTCITMTETRKKHLKTCWNQEPGRTNDLKWWDGFFDFIKESDFLMGRTSHKPFTGCNLEWITKIANFVKIREGSYNR